MDIKLAKTEALALLGASLLYGERVPEMRKVDGYESYKELQTKNYAQVIDSLLLMRYEICEPAVMAGYCNVDDYRFCARFYNEHIDYYYLLTF